MTIPKRTQYRYEAQRRFAVGDRLIRKSTGKVYILGHQQNVRTCWVMQLDPGKKGLVSYEILLKEFERE